MKKKAIIFDMDGVLVDSEPVYLDFFRKFLQRNNRTADEKLLLRTVGSSNRETWRLMAQMWGEACDPVWLESFYRSSCTDLVLPYQKVAFPGMKDTLRRLWEEGYTLLIASAAFQHSIQRMMEETEITPYIAGAISGETVRESKPSPDVYIQAITLSDCPAEECLAVEDSIYGIQAARRAGLEVATVHSSLFPEIQAMGDYPIGTVLGLLPLLGLSS